MYLYVHTYLYKNTTGGVSNNGGPKKMTPPPFAVNGSLIDIYTYMLIKRKKKENQKKILNNETWERCHPQPVFFLYRRLVPAGAPGCCRS